MNWIHWLVWGFSGTVVLTSILAASQGFGLTRMNIPYLLGTMFTPNRDRAMVTGFNDPNIKVTTNTVDHNTFQENINTYLQGQPDDVFTFTTLSPPVWARPRCSTRTSTPPSRTVRSV